MILEKIKDWILFWIWFILILLISAISYAAYSWIVVENVSVWDVLTIDNWNNVLNNQNYLKQEIESINANTIVDTKLTELEVDAFVSNNWYDTTPDTIADDWIIQENEIQQNSLDDSEIEDNSLTAASLAPNSVWNSELIDSPAFTNPTAATPTASNHIATKWYVDSSISTSWGSSKGLFWVCKVSDNYWSTSCSAVSPCSCSSWVSCPAGYTKVNISHAIWRDYVIYDSYSCMKN